MLRLLAYSYTCQCYVLPHVQSKIIRLRTLTSANLQHRANADAAAWGAKSLQLYNACSPGGASM